MGKSDQIEAFIAELLKTCIQDDFIELKRNELAQIFDCVPSQINYVISTRFNPQRGYAVESKRGGGGCVRIRRINSDKAIYRVINSIGTALDLASAKDYVAYLAECKEVDGRCCAMILAAVSEEALAPAKNGKNELRASILKNMLLELI